MSVRAKFRCNTTNTEGGQIEVHLSAVVSGSEENKEFWSATPSGHMVINITNPDAAGFFERGKEYYLDFSEANVGASA